ncbi:MAG: winged helix-turn-helix transcriptional regulator [Negativicutes bacterium]|jgi:DNA-binding transcriptional ArsR family regulator|nr:winged helix-turn-helix transcriptional regulator [Negativicutes bacterium]
MKEKMVQECNEEIIEVHHEDKVKLGKKVLWPEVETERISQLLKLLAEPSRLKLLQVLIHEEVCVCDLAEILEMTPSAVSHQLRLLRSAGIVRPRRDGQTIWYKVNDQEVYALVIYLEGGCTYEHTQI